jgi:tRNA A37 threonylcarbamoyladenosine synthetase subunit TsaC/SUA5/YrdC
LILPGETEAMTEGWEVKEALDHAVDAVIESGEVAAAPTTVIDFVDGVPEIVRAGAGTTARFA